MRTSGLTLYLLAVLIWGSTWLVIKQQLGVVDPAASVIYRFALASILLFLYSFWRGLPLRFNRQQHFLFATQGLFLFCINYLSFYHAELFISSGLVALVCSGMAFINIFGMRLFFSHPISTPIVLGSLLGITGIVLVFWPEVAAFRGQMSGWHGIVLACVGTLSASCGNLISVKQRRMQLPLIASVAWAMAWGVFFSLVYALITGVHFSFEPNWHYAGALLYLVILGSIVAFLCYLSLIERVGADKAAYVNVTVPIVALTLSTLVEGFQWQTLTWIGVGLSLAGNLLVMYKPRSRH